MQIIKFKHHITDKISEFNNKPMYKTYWFDEIDNTYKELESYIENSKIKFKSAILDKKRKVIKKENNITYYNFYEFKLNLNIFYKHPEKSLILRYLLLADELNTKYRECAVKYTENLDFYGRIAHILIDEDIKYFFYELYKKLPKRSSNFFYNLKGVLNFIFKHKLDINKLTELNLYYSLKDLKKLDKEETILLDFLKTRIFEK